MRLFVAVWPPADVIDGLRGLERPPVHGVRWTTPDQWHVTLRFLGELPSASALSAAIHGIALPAATAVMGPSAARPSPALLWLPVAGLDDLAAAVIGATASLGELEERPFRGHLTLARAGRRAARGAFRGLPALGLSARWEVEEVTVVRSTTGGPGARYEVIERFPVGA